MIDVYYVCDENGKIVPSMYTNVDDKKHYKVFLDKSVAISIAEERNMEYGSNTYVVRKDSFPYIGKYVSFIYLYRGFDYGFDYSFGGGSMTMSDAIYISKLYPSLIEAKTDPVYKSCMDKAMENPEKHIISDRLICSKDGDGEWFYGDIMEGKFNMKILRARVIKQ